MAWKKQVLATGATWLPLYPLWGPFPGGDMSIWSIISLHTCYIHTHICVCYLKRKKLRLACLLPWNPPLVQRPGVAGGGGWGQKLPRPKHPPNPTCSLSLFSQTFQLLHQLTDDRMKSLRVTSSCSTNITGCLLWNGSYRLGVDNGGPSRTPKSTCSPKL